MKLDSESWSCRQCGGGFIGRKPDDLICRECAAGADPSAALDDLIARSRDHPKEVGGDDG